MSDLHLDESKRETRIWPWPRVSTIDSPYWLLYGSHGAPGPGSRRGSYEPWPTTWKSNNSGEDDVGDVATTREGIESRVEVSNVFTGVNATGGVFGTTKSFLLHY